MKRVEIVISERVDRTYEATVPDDWDVDDVKDAFEGTSSREGVRFELEGKGIHFRFTDEDSVDCDYHYPAVSFPPIPFQQAML